MGGTNLNAPTHGGLWTLTCLVQLPRFVVALQQLLGLMSNLHGRPKSPTGVDNFQLYMYIHIWVGFMLSSFLGGSILLKDCFDSLANCIIISLANCNIVSLVNCRIAYISRVIKLFAKLRVQQ
jgi:hypothetical protein